MDTLAPFSNGFIFKVPNEKRRFVHRKTAHVAWLFYLHLDLAKLSLERGAQVNGVLPQEGGKTLLHLVAAFGSVAVAEMIIDAGADVNACGEAADTKTPLDDAVLEGRIAMVKLLVRRGASIEKYGETWDNALCTAALNGQLEVVKVFTHALESESIKRHYLLHYAASGGRVRVLEYLISLATNLETEDEDGLTPLGTAICDFKPGNQECG
ncbi:Tkl protein kinase, partial [Globisporangium splendens]